MIQTLYKQSIRFTGTEASLNLVGLKPVHYAEEGREGNFGRLSKVSNSV